MEFDLDLLLKFIRFSTFKTRKEFLEWALGFREYNEYYKFTGEKEYYDTNPTLLRIILGALFLIPCSIIMFVFILIAKIILIPFVLLGCIRIIKPWSF